MTTQDKLFASIGTAILGVWIGAFIGVVKNKNEMQCIRIGAVVGAVAGIIFIELKERNEESKLKKLGQL